VFGIEAPTKKILEAIWCAVFYLVLELVVLEGVLDSTLVQTTQASSFFLA
jgi:hypothetical protein